MMKLYNLAIHGIQKQDMKQITLNMYFESASHKKCLILKYSRTIQKWPIDRRTKICYRKAVEQHFFKLEVFELEIKLPSVC